MIGLDFSSGSVNTLFTDNKHPFRHSSGKTGPQGTLCFGRQTCIRLCTSALRGLEKPSGLSQITVCGQQPCKFPEIPMQVAAPPPDDQMSILIQGRGCSLANQAIYQDTSTFHRQYSLETARSFSRNLMGILSDSPIPRLCPSLVSFSLHTGILCQSLFIFKIILFRSVLPILSLSP